MCNGPIHTQEKNPILEQEVCCIIITFHFHPRKPTQKIFTGQIIFQFFNWYFDIEKWSVYILYDRTLSQFKNSIHCTMAFWLPGREWYLSSVFPWKNTLRGHKMFLVQDWLPLLQHTSHCTDNLFIYHRIGEHYCCIWPLYMLYTPMWLSPLR